MSARDSGGPAFPLANFQDNKGPVFGMTLRDYFAAKAMAALVGSPDLADQLAQMLNDDMAEGMSLVARLAYRTADAMLAARGDA